MVHFSNLALREGEAGGSQAGLLLGQFSETVSKFQKELKIGWGCMSVVELSWVWVPRGKKSKSKRMCQGAWSRNGNFGVHERSINQVRPLSLPSTLLFSGEAGQFTGISLELRWGGWGRGELGDSSSQTSCHPTQHPLCCSSRRQAQAWG